MTMNELTREQISAFADGELDEAGQDAMLAALRAQQAREDWDLYHQIGDVLRSDDMAVRMSAGFSARLAEQLDAEPTYVAPAARARSRRSPLRLVQSVAAAAAVATFAFVATPSMLESLQGGPAAIPALAEVEPAQEAQAVATSVEEGVILRDPRIDDYLMAHQRFSPSVNGSTQYVRSATFSGK